ncbi:MAG: hypothetical protein U9N59_10525 [Campylobacterota bacterium]|nr:hypothetical protein [Campylobacterota bacterium]
MIEEIETIRIEWDGPYSLTDIGYDKENFNYNNETSFLNDENKDIGVYQVYGCHPIYGNDVLLYIGKAAKQTFALRLSQEGWNLNEDFHNIKFYVGRLFDEYQPKSISQWYDMIDKAESMLIYAHKPARNSSNILNISKSQQKIEIFKNIRVLNYDNYRSLMPEISGELWVKGFDSYDGVFDSNLIK